MKAEKTVVRESRINGRGIFAAVPLPARRKIGEVSGRLVRLPQARTRVEREARIYLVELGPRLALDCSEGNDFRYLNHSCEPNCYLRVIRNTVEVYARTALAKGCELTVDYGETPHKGGMRCSCQSARCRHRL